MVQLTKRKGCGLGSGQKTKSQADWLFLDGLEMVLPLLSKKAKAKKISTFLEQL